MFKSIRGRFSALCLLLTGLLVSTTAAAEEESGIDVTEAVTSIQDAAGDLGQIGTAIVVVGGLVFAIGVVRGLLKT